jgi:hypothetical protein
LVDGSSSTYTAALTAENFVLKSTAGTAGNVNKIDGFDTGLDYMVFTKDFLKTVTSDDSIVTALTNGQVTDTNQLLASTANAPSAGTHLFTYDTDDGKLYWDADGNTASESTVLIADLDNVDTGAGAFTYSNIVIEA